MKLSNKKTKPLYSAKNSQDSYIIGPIKNIKLNKSRLYLSEEDLVKEKSIELFLNKSRADERNDGKQKVIKDIKRNLENLKKKHSECYDEVC